MTSDVTSRIKCEFCHKDFAGRSGLKYHIEAIHMDLKFNCSMCERVFKTQISLQTHYRSTHEKHRPYGCKLCGYSATSNSNLQQHVLAVHEKLRPFRCQQCVLTFALKQQLDRHVATVHERVRSYVCEVCHKRYTSAHGLQYHRAKLHQLFVTNKRTYIVTSASTASSSASQSAAVAAAFAAAPTSFQCHECVLAFDSIQRLRRHYNEIHKLMRYPCFNCRFVGVSTADLLSHLRRVCLLRPHECTRCQRRFTTRSMRMLHSLWHYRQDAARRAAAVAAGLQVATTQLVLAPQQRSTVTSSRSRRSSIVAAEIWPCLYCARHFDSVANVFAHVRAEHATTPS